MLFQDEVNEKVIENNELILLVIAKTLDEDLFEISITIFRIIGYKIDCEVTCLLIDI